MVVGWNEKKCHSFPYHHLVAFWFLNASTHSIHLYNILHTYIAVLIAHTTHNVRSLARPLSLSWTVLFRRKNIINDIASQQSRRSEKKHFKYKGIWLISVDFFLLVFCLKLLAAYVGLLSLLLLLVFPSPSRNSQSIYISLVFFSECVNTELNTEERGWFVFVSTEKKKRKKIFDKHIFCKWLFIVMTFCVVVCILMRSRKGTIINTI